MLGSIVGVGTAGRSTTGDVARGMVLGGVVGVASFVSLALLDEDGTSGSEFGGAVLIGGGPGALLGLIVGLTMPKEPTGWDPIPLGIPRECVETYWRYTGCASTGN